MPCRSSAGCSVLASERTVSKSAAWSTTGSAKRRSAESRGAGRRFPTLGLGQVDIELPTSDDVGALTERMQHVGVQAADDGRTVSFEDPWANRIQVRVAGS